MVDAISLFLFSSVFIHLYGCFVDMLISKPDIFYDCKKVYLKQKTKFSFISSKDYSRGLFHKQDDTISSKYPFIQLSK